MSFLWRFQFILPTTWQFLFSTIYWQLSPSSFGKVKGTCVFTRIEITYYVDILSSSYSIYLNFRCSFGIVLYISVGEILKTINTQICLVLTLVLHLLPTALAIVYIFGRWFTPYTKWRFPNLFTILFSMIKKNLTSTSWKSFIGCHCPHFDSTEYTVLTYK